MPWRIGHLGPQRDDIVVCAGIAEEKGKAAFVGEASTIARFPLAMRPLHIQPSTGAPILLDREGEGASIEGEVFEVDDSTLQAPASWCEHRGFVGMFEGPGLRQTSGKVGTCGRTVRLKVNGILDVPVATACHGPRACSTHSRGVTEHNMGHALAFLGVWLEARRSMRS